MIKLLKQIPLGTRYAIGFCFVLISGIAIMYGTHVSYTDEKMLWLIMTIGAVIHWLGTLLYMLLERRWYRFFALAFSALATGSYIEMSLRVWSHA